MPNTIQLREHSKSGDVEDALYNSSRPKRQPLRPLPLLGRRQVELELQLARQRLECR